MSKYFETLSRLGDGRAAQGYSRSTKPLSDSNLQSGQDFVPSYTTPILADLPLAGRKRVLSGLLNALRELSDGSARPVAVLAGVPSIEPVTKIVSGLATQASSEGIRLLVGEIVESKKGRMLKTTLCAADPGRADVPPYAYSEQAFGAHFELTGQDPQEVLNSWLQAQGRTHDIALILARPILDSADATLMAKAGAGLVLAVLPGVTTRAALKKAVSRTQASGARLLGIVLCEGGTHLPGWLKKLFSGSAPDRQPHSSSD